MRTRSRPSPNPIWVPESRVMSPPPNRASPITIPVTVTVRVAAREKITIARYFTASSRARWTGTVSR